MSHTSPVPYCHGTIHEHKRCGGAILRDTDQFGTSICQGCPRVPDWYKARAALPPHQRWLLEMDDYTEPYPPEGERHA